MATALFVIILTVGGMNVDFSKCSVYFFCSRRGLYSELNILISIRGRLQPEAREDAPDMELESPSNSRSRLGAESTTDN